MSEQSKTTGVTPLDNFHSDELRAELARRDAITEEAVQLYKSLTQTTAEPAFAVIDASGLIDPMSVRRHASTCFVYAGMRRLEDQGPFRVVPVKIVVAGEAVQNV